MRLDLLLALAIVSAPATAATKVEPAPFMPGAVIRTKACSAVTDWSPVISQDQVLNYACVSACLGNEIGVLSWVLSLERDTGFRTGISGGTTYRNVNDPVPPALRGVYGAWYVIEKGDRLEYYAKVQVACVKFDLLD